MSKPTPPSSPPPDVLAYESRDAVRRGRGWRVAMWVFAVLSLLGGIGQAGGAGTLASTMLADGGDPEAVFWAPVMAIAAAGGALATVGALLLIARRAPWRVPVLLTVAAAVAVLVALAMMGLCVAYRRATGWDSLTVAIGFVFAIAATAVTWTDAATAVLALRVGQADGTLPVERARMLARCAIGIAIIPLAAGAVAYVLYLFLP